MEASIRNFVVGRPTASLIEAFAAVLDSALAIGALAVTCRIHHEPFDGPELMLSMLVFALMFPSPVPYFSRARGWLRDIFSNWGFVCFVLLFFGYAGRFLGAFDQRVLAEWGLAVPILLAASHLIYPIATRTLAIENARSAVVVGMSPLAVSLVGRMNAATHHRLLYRGYFDDRGNDRILTEIPDDAVPGDWLGTVDSLHEYVVTHGIDVVYLTLPISSHPRITKLMQSLRDTTASIYVVPNIFMVDLIQARIDEMEGIPLLAICETPFQGVSGLLKRVLDIIVSVLALTLLAPLLLAVAILIKLESPGPVIFVQRRYGLDGREIEVYKFRSMRVVEDGRTQYQQVTKGDPRITRVGRILRKTSIDEIPQFLNVLQGSMSVVGPRPHVVAVNERYRKLISGYMVRHKVRPGITGWAQVNGFRGGDDIDSMRQRIEYDLQYLRNWSLQMDVMIIFRTMLVVLKDQKAF